MKRDYFDDKLKKALTAASESVGEPNGDMLENIKNDMRVRNMINDREEKSMMKSFKFKVLAVCAVLCAFSVTCYAVGNIASWTATTQVLSGVSYSDMDKVKEDLGVDFKCPEQFSNGFKFDSAGTGKTEAYDANGGVIGEGKNANITYKNDSGETLSLGVREVVNGEDVESSVYGYSNEKMVIFPGDDETNIAIDDEIENYDELGCQVSFGTVDEKTEQTYETICWEDGGLIYSLTSFDTNMGEDVFNQLVEEVKSAQ